jgi:hypothetical protein
MPQPHIVDERVERQSNKQKKVASYKKDSKMGNGMNGDKQ